MSEANGGRFIDKLIAASPTERRKITVLGQDVYFRPLTRKMLRDAMPKDDVEREPDYVGLFTLVHCAEYEDGSKVFAMTDIEDLRARVSVEFIRQLEAVMLGALAPSVNEAKKQIEADPPSASV